MKTKSVKAKGRKLQNTVRDALRDIYVNTTRVPKLKVDDIKSQTMGMPGEDIVLSPKAQEVIPYSFECKNVEKLSIWKAIEQCEQNSNERIPVVVFKKNGKVPHITMSLDNFINLLLKERR